jgi:hypothetical protein
LAAGCVPEDPSEVPPEDVQEAYETIAVAAVEEAMKFVPPGERSVSREALWAPLSLTSYDIRPEQFTRRRMMVLLGTYRQVLAAYSWMAG